MTPVRDVLITGAAGFFGTRIASVLSARGLRVTGLDATLPGRSIDVERAGFSAFWQSDLVRGRLPAAAAGRRFDVIVHLAGLMPEQVSRAELFAANVGGTSTLLERFAWRGSHLVFLSTGLVYGEQPGPFCESMPCLAIEPYGQSKLAAESLLRAWSNKTESPLTVFRPAVVYGPAAPAESWLVSLLRTLKAGAPYSCSVGERVCDLLHVDDAAEAVATAIERRVVGTWNLASGQSASLRRVAELAAGVAQRRELLQFEDPTRSDPVADCRLDPSGLEHRMGFRARIGLEPGLSRMWQDLA